MHFYRRLVAHHWRFIAATVLVCLVVSAAYVRLAPSRYQAEAQLFVGTTSSSQDSAGLNQSGQYVQARVKSYVGLVTTPGVLDPVREDLGLDVSTSELAAEVSASVPVDTVLIDVTVTDDDPALARDVAGAVAQQLSQEIERLETPPTGGASQITVVPTRAATLPTAAVGQPALVVLGLGALAGLALGLGSAVMIDVVRPRLRDRSDVEAVLGIPVLADLPGDRRGTPPAALKHLRTQLTARQDPRTPRSLFLTGTEPGTDTARLTLDLARTFAASGQRIVIVDGDIERRGLTRMTGAHPQCGLVEVIGGTPVEEALVDVGIPGVSLLSSRGDGAEGLEIAFSSSLSEVLAVLAGSYDLVIVSGASAEEDADVLLWASATAGMVVVIRSGALLPRVRGSLELLGGAQATLLGAVLMAPRSLGRRPTSGGGADASGTGRRSALELPAGSRIPLRRS